MTINHNELRYGELDLVSSMVDEYAMDADTLRTVILNLIDRIQKLEKARVITPGDSGLRSSFPPGVLA